MSRKFSDMGDKEFDDFLKNLSESPDIPFQEEDWERMKARMASPNAKPLPSNRWTAFAWFGILSALLLGIYLGGNAIWNTNAPIHNQVKTVQELNVENSAGQLANTDFTEERSSAEKSPLNSTPGKADFDPAISTVQRFQVKKWNSQASIVPDFAAESVKKLAALEENQANQVISLELRPDLFQLVSLKNKLDGVTSRHGVTSRPFVQPGGMEPESNKTQNWFAGRFDLSVQAAPDLSGVKLNQLGQAGQAMGLGVEYFISPLVSINSGVFYSHKPYESDESFRVGYGDKVNKVIGDCSILDIPVNLRYYPLQGMVQRAFVSIGLSSYLMLTETYEIIYQDPATGYDYTRTIEKKGENQHPFGVVNLSLGYERKLANRLSLQVEPYFKVPINGVGEGNISLKSTGIFLGLKYYPGR